ncbi:MAG: hypothetical protein ACXVHL_32635 [Solirubrobacteraceae bacterium]
MKAAGYQHGRYTGSGKITVVGATGDPYAPAAQIVNQTLRNLGFKTSFTLVDQSVMFSKFCNVPAREVDVCPNAGWVRDFADPQTILDPTFAGYNIAPSGNANLGQVDNPQNQHRDESRRADRRDGRTRTSMGPDRPHARRHRRRHSLGIHQEPRDQIP